MGLERYRGGPSMPAIDAAVAAFVGDTDTDTGAALNDAFVRHGGDRGDAWLTLDADYTGTEDASAAMNAAYVTASTYGLNIRMRQGTLRLESAVTARSGVRLVGAGAHATVVKPIGAINGFIGDGTAMDPLTNVGFEDFELDGSGQTNGGGGYTAEVGKGFFMRYIRRALFRNLYVHETIATGIGVDHLTGLIENCTVNTCGRGNNGSQGGGSGIGIGTGLLNATWEELTISNCHTAGNARYGIFLENQSANRTSGIKIIGCTARGNKDGIGECGTTGAIILGNSVWGNTRAGIACDSGTITTGTPGYYTIVQANTVYANAYGILVNQDENADSIDGIRIMDNLVHGNTADGIWVKSYDDPAAGYNFRRLRISRNDCHSNGNNGIYVSYATGSGTGRTMARTSIDGNRCWNNGTAAVSGHRAGIHINVACSTLHVRDNRCWDDGTSTQTHGIYFNPAAGGRTCTDLTMTGNEVGGATAPMTVPTTLAGTNIIRHNRGYNPVGPIARTVGASPWTYTAATTDETLHLIGGTITGVTKGGVSLGAEARTVSLVPGGSVVVTYLSAPTAVADRH